jgi:hypothetical protein
MPRYLAELYVSRSCSGALSETAFRALRAANEMTLEGTPVRYLRAILLGDDEVCFHLYEAASSDAVREACRRAEIPLERVTEAVDIDPDASGPGGRSERCKR